jgi:hypothetical protein
MPTRKAKAARQAAKRTEARNRALAQTRPDPAKGSGVPELPTSSVRLRKSLKNRTKA